MKTKALTTLIVLLALTGCATTTSTVSADTTPTDNRDAYAICKLNPHGTIIDKDGKKAPCSSLGLAMVKHSF